MSAKTEGDRLRFYRTGLPMKRRALLSCLLVSSIGSSAFAEGPKIKVACVGDRITAGARRLVAK